MSKSNTKELLSIHLNELQTKRNEILAKSAPLREKRDKILNDARAAAKVISDQVKEIEKDLFAIDTDTAKVAQALGGRKMSDLP